MYAIIELGGRQWKVEPGTRLAINRVPTPVGQPHTVDHVLFTQDGAQVKIGRPYISGATVVCEVLAHSLGPKVISYHYRRRENWRKTVGHRQMLTQLIVKEIIVGGKSAVAARPEKAKSPPALARVPKTSTIKPKAPTLKASTAKKDQHGA